MQPGACILASAALLLLICHPTDPPSGPTSLFRTSRSSLRSWRGRLWSRNLCPPVVRSPDLLRQGTLAMTNTCLAPPAGS